MLVFVSIRDTLTRPRSKVCSPPCAISSRLRRCSRHACRNRGGHLRYACRTAGHWAGSPTKTDTAISRRTPIPQLLGRRCPRRCWRYGARLPATRSRRRRVSSTSTLRAQKWACTRTATRSDFDAPVISISLGDSCLFRVGGQKRSEPTQSIRLSSGDVVVLGGAARLAFHGVDRIYPGTSRLLPEGGRINLTLRRVTRSTSDTRHPRAPESSHDEP